MKYLLILFLLSNLLFAAPTSGAGFANVFDAFQKNIELWVPIVQSASLYVFWALAAIDFAWTFGFMALKGFEFGELASTLIKKIIMIGVFLLLYQWYYGIPLIIESFQKLTDQVVGIETIKPENVVALGANTMEKMYDAISIGSIPQALLFIISGLICLICILFMALDLILAYLKYYLLIPIAFFALALGGIENFKQTALNPIFSTIKIGIEIFLITGLISICMIYINLISANIQAKMSTELAIQAVCVAFLCSLATKMVPSLIEAVFVGGVGDRANAGAGFRAVATAAFATMGAASKVAKVGGAVAGGVAKGGIGVARTLMAAQAMNKETGAHTGMGSTISSASKAYFSDMKQSLISAMSSDRGNRVTESLKAEGAAAKTERSTAAASAAKDQASGTISTGSGTSTSSASTGGTGGSAANNVNNNLKGK